MWSRGPKGIDIVTHLSYIFIIITLTDENIVNCSPTTECLYQNWCWQIIATEKLQISRGSILKEYGT